MNVARQAVELGDDHWRLTLAASASACGELWTAVEGVGALAAFDLHKVPGDLQAFGGRCKACEHRFLRFEAQA